MSYKINVLEAFDLVDDIEIDDILQVFRDYGYEAFEHKFNRALKSLEDIESKGLYNLYRIYLNEEDGVLE
jgi:16S rRNA C1402 N4-methylase RsmH